MNKVGNYIKELLKKGDLILEELKDTKTKLTNVTLEIIKKDKSKEEVDDEDILEYNTISLYSYILNDEFRKTMLKAVGVYGFGVKTSTIEELGLDDVEVKKLDSFVKADLSNFLVDNKGKLVPRNSQIMEVLKERASQSNFNKKEKLIEALRKSELYGKS